jgi:hypothetical protein
MKGTGELRDGRDKSGPYTRAIPMKGTGELRDGRDKSGPYTRAMNCHRHLINALFDFEQYLSLLEGKPCLSVKCDHRDEIHEKEMCMA